MIKLRNITKNLSNSKILDDINVNIKQGEVHCIVGHNGAGKSSLLKILAGFWQPDSGEIIFEGQKVKFASIIESSKYGIALIPQEPIMVNSRTVAENIFIVNPPLFYKTIIHKKLLYLYTKNILRKLKSDIPPFALVKNLNLAQKETIAIARALVLEPQVILFDEPTAFFSPQETVDLFNIIKELKEQKETVIFVGHRLNEIIQIADMITVLRNGKCIGTFEKNNIDLKKLTELITGNKVHKRTRNKFNSRNPSANNASLLEVRNLSVAERGVKRVKNISFDLHQKEILGIGGLLGAGKTEILKAIVGLMEKESGEIFINREKVNISSINVAWDFGIRLLPEDRLREGLFLNLPVDKNIILSCMEEVTRKYFLDDRKIKSVSAGFVNNFDINIASLSQKVKYLSGGNQQKVLLANKINSNPKILLIDEPTRGVDVGAKFKIYDLIQKIVKEKSIGVIIASCELSELVELCDRVLILTKGEIKKDINNFNFIRESEMFDM